jgi:hypothetical protein
MRLNATVDAGMASFWRYEDTVKAREARFCGGLQIPRIIA